MKACFYSFTFIDWSSRVQLEMLKEKLFTCPLLN